MGQQADTWGYVLFLIVFTLTIGVIFSINTSDYFKIYNQWRNNPEIDQGVSQNLALAMALLNLLLAVVSFVMFLFNVVKLWRGPAKPSTYDVKPSKLGSAVSDGGLKKKVGEAWDTLRGKPVVYEATFTGTVEPPARTRPDFAGTGTNVNSSSSSSTPDPNAVPNTTSPNISSFAQNLAGLMGQAARAASRPAGT